VAAGDLHSLNQRLVLDTSEEQPTYLLIGQNRSYIRLSSKAYHILHGVTSGITYDRLAGSLSQQEGRSILPKDVEAAYKEITERVEKIDGKTKPNPRGFWIRFQLIPERIVTGISRHLSVAFRPVPALVLIATIIIAISLGLRQNLFANLINSVSLNPAAFWSGYALFLVSLIFHEFGHAGACARYGARPSGIGFTTYLIYPALYSDVSAAWQLRRRQRVIVDLGGIFFQLVVGSCYVFIYNFHKWESLKIAVVMILGNCIFSLNPILKFDGYWVVADALGVVNLGQQPGRILKHFLNRLRGRQVKPLPWPTSISAILAIYTLVSLTFWVSFLLAIFPFLWYQISSYPVRVATVAGRLFDPPHSLPAGDLHSLFVSTYIGFIMLLILKRMAKAVFQSAKSLLSKQRDFTTKRQRI
jgi:putative peptide zinc metalloprotease protein